MIDRDAVSRFAFMGRQLLSEDDGHRAQIYFSQWDSSVAQWLDDEVHVAGLSAEWSSLGFPSLPAKYPSPLDNEQLKPFRELVLRRLGWLANLTKALQSNGDASTQTAAHPSGRVFVVHGRNEGVRESVARFLERIGLVPVILHEQPNLGRTLIEKFVEYADVGFAVVLLTGDDSGRLTAGVQGPERPRARQNVVFELGFFIGKIGRAKVCALYEDGVELPSDYDGVLYLPLGDHNAWQLQIARELRAAGLPVDMNKL